MRILNIVIGGKNMLVKKRNGQIVEFDKTKIIEAINKAFIEVDGQLYEDETASDIASEIEVENNTYILDVETIQDLVEDKLMDSERKDVAKAYVRYRYKREVARNNKEEFFKAIAEKLEAKDIENSNANVDEHSFGGRIGEASNVMTK